MRLNSKSLKMRSSPDSRLIHRREGRVDKTKKRKDHQTIVLLINARAMSTNQKRICEVCVDYSKLHEEVKGTKSLCVSKGESHL